MSIIRKTMITPFICIDTYTLYISLSLTYFWFSQQSCQWCSLGKIQMQETIICRKMFILFNIYNDVIYKWKYHMQKDSHPCSSYIMMKKSKYKCQPLSEWFDIVNPYATRLKILIQSLYITKKNFFVILLRENKKNVKLYMYYYYNHRNISINLDTSSVATTVKCRGS